MATASGTVIPIPLPPSKNRVRHLRYRINSFVSVGATVLNLFDVYPDEIEAGSDVLTDLGGRFRYPWEVNQFGFAGTTASGSLDLTF